MYGALNGDWSWELRVDGEGVKGLRGVVWFREQQEIENEYIEKILLSVRTEATGTITY